MHSSKQSSEAFNSNLKGVGKITSVALSKSPEPMLPNIAASLSLNLAEVESMMKGRKRIVSAYSSKAGDNSSVTK